MSGRAVGGFALAVEGLGLPVCALCGAAVPLLGRSQGPAGLVCRACSRVLAVRDRAVADRAAAIAAAGGVR